MIEVADEDTHKDRVRLATACRGIDEAIPALLESKPRFLLELKWFPSLFSKPINYGIIAGAIIFKL